MLMAYSCIVLWSSKGGDPCPIQVRRHWRRYRGSANRIARLLAAGAAQLVCSVALAQQASGGPVQTAQADTGGLQEVVVTARYRAENLQQTPIAIYCSELRGARGASVHQPERPGLQGAERVFPAAGQQTTDRPRRSDCAVSPRSTTATRSSPRIAIYFDDIYHGTMTGSSMDLADLDHIEVLNGPQGTLFGKNSLGVPYAWCRSSPRVTTAARSKRLWTTSPHGRQGPWRTSPSSRASCSRVSWASPGRRTASADTWTLPVRWRPRACRGLGSLPMTVTPTQGNGCALGDLGGLRPQGCAGSRYVTWQRMTWRSTPPLRIRSRPTTRRCRRADAVRRSHRYVQQQLLQHGRFPRNTGLTTPITATFSRRASGTTTRPTATW